MKKRESKIREELSVLTSADASEIAKIHMQALNGDFLPSLGLNFLKTFYSGVVDKRNVHGFAFRVDGKIYGFVVGTTDSRTFFKEAIKSKFASLLIFLLIGLVKRPANIKNIFETFLYPKKEKGLKAELVVIAVGRRYRGLGIGKKLTKELEKVFVQKNIKKYKVTVHADKAAVNFYEHLGYSRKSSFSLYDKMWYMYEKKIKL